MIFLQLILQQVLCNSHQFRDPDMVAALEKPADHKLFDAVQALREGPSAPDPPPNSMSHKTNTAAATVVTHLCLIPWAVEMTNLGE